MAFDIESRSKRMHAVDREILLSFWKAHILKLIRLQIQELYDEVVAENEKPKSK